MLNLDSVEDSGVVKVLAMPSKAGKNLTYISVPYVLAVEHVRGLYAVGYLSLGTICIQYHFPSD